MLSGYLLSVHSLLTILLSSVWTPLIILFFRRAIQGEFAEQSVGDKSRCYKLPFFNRSLPIYWRRLAGQGFKNEILTAVFITISFRRRGEIVCGNFVLLLMVIFLP
jgi:hypothetical protein